jgi:multiple sugar transport system permease protein
VSTIASARPALAAPTLRRTLGRDYRLGYVFTLPIVLLVLGLVAYPFLYAVYSA